MTLREAWIDRMMVFVDHLNGDFALRLGDAAGNNRVSGLNSGGVETYRIDSVGRGAFSELQGALDTGLAGRLVAPKAYGVLGAAIEDDDTSAAFGAALPVGSIVVLTNDGLREYVQTGSRGSSGGLPGHMHVPDANVEGVYTITRDLTGSGALDWRAGTMWYALGVEGDYWIELKNEYGNPRLDMFTLGASLCDLSNYFHVGGMNGLFGVSGTAHGVGIGDYSGGNYIRFSDVGGLQINAGGVNLATAFLPLSGGSITGDLNVDGKLGLTRGINGNALLDSYYGLDYLTGHMSIDAYAYYGYAYLAAGDNEYALWQELLKTRSEDGSTHATVQNGDELGVFNFYGDDGSDFRPGASIKVSVDGTPAALSMPGRIVFETAGAADYAAVERMRITSAGNVGIGTNAPDTKLHVVGDVTLSGKFISTLATGIPPLQVESDTRVSNLNADLLDGIEAAGFVQQDGSGNVAVTGDLTLSGAAKRIIGNFTTNTLNDRPAFQSSVVNGNTSVAALPNGTSVNANMRAYNASDPTNAAYVGFALDNTVARFQSGVTGTGTQLPMVFMLNTTEAARFSTGGSLLIGTTTDGMTASGSLAIAQDLAHRGTKVGFFNVTPATRPTAYTQTYSTASKTVPNPTAAALTDNSGGTASTTLEAIGTSFNQGQIRNNFADLAAMVNKNTADYAALLQVVTALIDDLQALGLVQ